MATNYDHWLSTTNGSRNFKFNLDEKDHRGFVHIVDVDSKVFFYLPSFVIFQFSPC